LPTLPPIPEKSVVAEVEAEIVKVEAPVVETVVSVAPVSVAPVIVAAAPVASEEVKEATATAAAPLRTTDAEATATHAHVANEPDIEPAPAVTSTSIDFHAHLETVARMDAPSAAAPAASETVHVQTESHAVTEPVAEPVAPSQGDLLAHAEPAHVPATTTETEEPAAGEDVGAVKKDASHG
jgi:hypothetical protein